VPLSQQIKGLHDDLYDVGFAQSDEVGDGVVALPVWHDPLMVAVPAKHPLLSYKRIPREELLRYPLALGDPQACEGYVKQIDRVLRRVDMEPLVATTARLNNALRRLGSGWALFVEAERRTAADYPHSVFPEPLSWLVDEERRAAFEESGHHFESSYHLTLVYLPPEESRARAAGMLYENRPSEGVDWREWLDAFIAETDRIFDLLDGVMQINVDVSGINKMAV